MYFFSSLYARVRAAWTVSPGQYPTLDCLTDDGHRRLFLQSHVLKHMAKAVGRLNGVLERREHGTAVETWEDVDALRCLLVGIMKYIDVSGLSTDDVQKALMDWADVQQKRAK